MRNTTIAEGIPGEGDVLLYIGTSWCKYCGFTKPAVEKAERERPGLTALMIDGDEELDALPHYGEKTYPTLILFRDGKEVARRQSAKDDVLAEWLDEHSAPKAA